MNRFFNALLLSSLLSSVALCQLPVQLAPLPTGSNLAGVAFTSPDVGWVVGKNKACFKTVDHGLTWSPVTLPGLAGGPLYSALFVNSQLGFIIGNATQPSRDAFRTTDGGATWEIMPSVPFGSWSHLKFPTSTTGFMGANGAILRTTNAGQSWTLQSGYPDCPVIYGMDFLDANTGIVGGSQISTHKAGIFKTTDGGVTWQNKRLSNGSNDVIYLNSTTLLADEGVSILRSNDAGETWFPISTVPTGLADMEKVGANVIVGVSTGGDVWRSADGGFSWSQRWNGVSDLPADWNVRFSDALNGHVVGQGGTILETRDGGVTWNWLNRGMSFTWNAIAAFSDTHLALVGFHGAVQSTTDGGIHWDTRVIDAPTFGRDTDFSDIAVTGPNTAVAVGHWGGLFKTFNRGASWVDMSNAFNQSFYPEAVTFTDANNGWVTGWDYNSDPKIFLRRTQDGGATWQPASRNIPGYDIEFVGQTGYVLTDESMFKTINGGTTWIEKPISVQGGETPFQNSHMAWTSSDVGYVTGLLGFVARTADGGTTWSRVLPYRNDFVYTDVAVRGSNEIWICGSRNGGGNEVVMRSLDSGATWESVPLPSTNDVPMRIVIGSQYVYVAMWGGGVWRFDLADGQVVNPISFSVLRGTLNSGGLASFVGIDQNYMVIQSSLAMDRREAPLQLVVEGIAQSITASDLKFDLAGHVDAQGVSRTVELFDWTANSYVVVDTRLASTSDSTAEVTAPNPGRFVQNGTRAVRAKLSYFVPWIRGSYPFKASVDQAIWRIKP